MNSVLSLLPHDMTVLNRVGVFCTLENSVEFQKWLSAGGYKASLFAFEGRQRWFSVMLMGTSWLSYLHCDTINKVLVTRKLKSQYVRTLQPFIIVRYLATLLLLFPLQPLNYIYQKPYRTQTAEHLKIKLDTSLRLAFCWCLYKFFLKFL